MKISGLIWPIVFLTSFLIQAVIVLVVFAPTEKAGLAVTAVLGFSMPTLAALVAILKTSEELKEINKTGKDVYTLVNSNMIIQLKLNSELSRWKANQTKDNKDIQAADQAEKLLQEHITKQSSADEQKVKSA